MLSKPAESKPTLQQQQPANRNPLDVNKKNARASVQSRHGASRRDE